MKKLLLLRHAQTEDHSESGQDIDRKLNAEGMKNASLLGNYLKKESIYPQVIFSSYAQRAVVTAELVASQLEHPIDQLQIVEELYKAGARGFLNFLQGLSDKWDSVAIVAHNPTISHIADYLCHQNITTMAPASLVHLNFDLESWQQLDKESGEFLGYYDLPQLV